MNSTEQLPSRAEGTSFWLQLGQDGETESTLLGNVAGLKALREAIDHALQHGDCDIIAVVSDLTAVRCVDEAQESVTPTSYLGVIGACGCLAVLLIIGALVSLGIWRLVKFGLPVLGYFYLP